MQLQLGGLPISMNQFAGAIGYSSCGFPYRESPSEDSPGQRQLQESLNGTSRQSWDWNQQAIEWLTREE